MIVAALTHATEHVEGLSRATRTLLAGLLVAFICWLMAKRSNPRRDERRRETKKATQQQPTTPSTAAAATNSEGPPRPGWFRGLITSVWFWLSLIVSVIATLLGIYLPLWPDLDVKLLDALDPQNPFSTPIEVTNSGYWPVATVYGSCMVHATRHGRDFNEGANVYGGLNLHIPRLTRGQPATIPCDRDPSTDVVTSAQLVVLINYTPAGLPLPRLRDGFRFEGALDSQRRVRWLQQPIRDEDWDLFERVIRGHD